jgi:hypothetical protein
MNTLTDWLTRVLGANWLEGALADLRLNHARLGQPSPPEAEAEIERVLDELHRKLEEAFPEEPPPDDDTAAIEATFNASKVLLRELLLHFHRAVVQTPFIGPSVGGES